MASSKAIDLLVNKAQALENRVKRQKLEENLTMEKVVGFAAAGGMAVLGGYLDGNFDLSDDKAGDGVTLFGIPVVPVAGGALALTGLLVGDKAGSALMFSALGLGCGWSYKTAYLKGLEKAASK